MHDDAFGDDLYRPPRWWPALVMLQGAAGAEHLPMRALCQGVADALVRDFRDHVQIILAEPGNPRSRPSEDLGAWPHRRVVFVSERDPVAATTRLLEVVDATWKSYAYTFLDTSALGAAFTDQVVDRIGAAPPDPALHLRLVQVRDVRGQRSQDVPRAWRILRTRLLTHPAVPSGLKRRQLAKWVGTDGLKRLAGLDREPRAEPYPEGTPPEHVNVNMRVGVGREASAAGNFSLWARAVSNRRVGLALGGSGAWGYAHAALIDRLTRSTADIGDDETRAAFAETELDAAHDLHVPVDLIASASSGSLVGAYYAVLGAPGLEKIIDIGWELQLALPVAMVTMLSLELLVARDLGHIEVDDLELMFYPVVTNLTAAEAEYVRFSPVPWAVRASASFPGFFASTIADGAVYCDGAIADNVPASLVDALGADLVVATNPLPPPEGMKIRPPCGPIARFIREANPVFRTWELLSAASLMLHTAGDWESEHYILYDPPPSAFPLVGTYAFAKSRQIYLNVLKEPTFQATVVRSKRSWALLARPRHDLAQRQAEESAG